MILGSDQGVVVTVNGAQTWSSWYNQPTAQFYHVATDDAFPFSAYGAQQDSGAAMQPSRSKYATISQQDFRPIDVGGESGTLAPDPRHPGSSTATSGQAARRSRKNLATGWEQNVDPTLDLSRHALAQHVDAADRVLAGRSDVALLRRIRTSSVRATAARRGRSSAPISRAPTKERRRISIPTTLADNNGLLAPRRRLCDRAVAAARAASSGPAPTTATSGSRATARAALEQRHAAGAHRVEQGRHHRSVALRRATAYLAVDRHRLEDYAPYIYRTRDGGATWTPIANGIPDGSFVNVVREDPKRRGLLYAGTERGVYVSFDDGAHWQSLQLNLPVTSVRDIAVHGDDLVDRHARPRVLGDGRRRAVASDGRRAWPPAATICSRPRRAYRVRPATKRERRFRWTSRRPTTRRSACTSTTICARARRTPVVIEIFDADGRVVRRWSSARSARSRSIRSRSTSRRTGSRRIRVPVTHGRRASFRVGFSPDASDGPLAAAGSLHGATDRRRQDATAQRARRARSAHRRERCGSARAIRAARRASKRCERKSTAARDARRTDRADSSCRRPRAQRSARDHRRRSRPTIPTIRSERTRTTSRASSTCRTRSIISKARSKAPTRRRRPTCAAPTPNSTRSIAQTLARAQTQLSR